MCLSCLNSESLLRHTTINTQLVKVLQTALFRKIRVLSQRTWKVNTSLGKVSFGTENCSWTCSLEPGVPRHSNPTCLKGDWNVIYLLLIVWANEDAICKWLSLRGLILFEFNKNLSSLLCSSIWCCLLNSHDGTWTPSLLTWLMRFRMFAPIIHIDSIRNRSKMSPL